MDDGIVAAVVSSAEPAEEGREVRRQLRARLDALTGDRMRERELGRVQELAPEHRLGDAVGRVTGRSTACRCTRI